MSVRSLDVASQAVQSCLEIISPLRLVFPSWYQRFESLQQEFTNERLRIGVVGVTSSGKSAFINALLGEALLPEQSKATTNLPVICRKGSTRKLLVVFTNRGTKEYTGTAVSASLVKSFCAEDENPGNQKGVWRVEIETPSCCLDENLEIIDTPGTDAYGLDSHEEITLYRCLPISDIVIFMTHSLQGGLQANDVRLLANVIEHDQRVIFVISYSDKQKDDYENRLIVKSRQEKLRIKIATVSQSLNAFPTLKESGIVAVSSKWAQNAGGDRTTQDWRESNFDEVLNLFDRLKKDLKAGLLELREARTRALITFLVSAIDPQSGGRTLKSGRTQKEEELAARVDLLKKSELFLTQKVDDLRKTAATALQSKSLIDNAKAELGTLDSSDVAEVCQIWDRLKNRWESLTRNHEDALNEVRSTCRHELRKLHISPSRKSIKDRALHTETFPSVRNHIVNKTESYQVEVWRGGFGIMDLLFGPRLETQTRSRRSVNLKLVQEHITGYLTSASRDCLEFFAEQCEMLTAIYIEPVRIQLAADNGCLSDLEARTLSADQFKRLPNIIGQLQSLIEHKLPTTTKRTDSPLAPLVRNAFTESPLTPSQDMKSVAKQGESLAPLALYGILARAWECVAIRRFWEIVSTIHPSATIESVLWVGRESSRFKRLIQYLTRNAARHYEDSLSPDKVIIIDTYGHGNVQMSYSCTDSPLPSKTFVSRCASASVIAIDFDAIQPSSGLKTLVNDPRYRTLVGYSNKTFFTFMDGAVYDERLHELSETIMMVDRHTVFTSRPWYVCEHDRYDARYSDFLFLCADACRASGSARDLIRRWRSERLSMLPPFTEHSLSNAYAHVLVKESITAHEQHRP